MNRDGVAGAVGRVLIGVLVMLAVVVVLEVGARLGTECRISGIAYDQGLGWRLRRGHESEVLFPWGEVPVQLSFNGDGFRDRGHPRQKPEGVRRVMVVGDSYTAGLETPADQIFTTLLETRLRGPETVVGGYDVMNVGVGAWATDQQYIYLREEGGEYAPDVVLIAVAPNDVRESYAKGFFRVDSGALVQRGPDAPPLPARVGWGLSNRSCAFQALQTALGTGHGAPREIFRHYPLHFPVEGGVIDDVHLFETDPRPEVAAALELFDTLVLAIDDWCRAEGCALHLTVVPTKIEFDGSLPGIGHEPARIARHVEALASTRGIPYLDLHAAVEASGVDPLTLFIEEEYHLTPAGHALVAESLAEWLGRGSG